MRPASVMKASFLLNVALFSIHEMQAMVWKEWRLFGFTDDTVGMNLFAFAHIPLYIILFAALMYPLSRYGRILSLAFGLFMPVHLALHVGAYRNGYFTDPFSFAVIVAAAMVSVVQFSATIILVRRSGAAG